MTSSDKPHHPGKTQVPGQLLGYGLQYSRMVSLLLEADAGSTVSLEVFEDVGVQSSDGALASQTKSSTTKNPVSNRAEPFWKTLKNWLSAIGAGQLDTKGTLFELYVFGDFEGEICGLFSEARSVTEAKEALDKAKSLLEADGNPLPDLINGVLQADEPALLSLITKFRYNHGSGSSEKDLKEQLGKAL